MAKVANIILYKFTIHNYFRLSKKTLSLPTNYSLKTSNIMKNSQEKYPRSYLGLGMFVTCVLFCPLGILAIYNGAFVKKYWEYGDIENALKHSKKAKMWGLISIPAGIIWWLGICWFIKTIASLF